MFQNPINDEKNHNKLGEFSTGLKKDKSARVYSVILMTRRILFVTWLIVFNHFDKMLILSIMAVIQIGYLTTLLLIRPFEEKMNSVIEIMNEFIFSFLLSVLFFVNSEAAWTGFRSSIYIWVMTANSIVLVLILTGNLVIVINNRLIYIQFYEEMHHLDEWYPKSSTRTCCKS
jgi:hypothetical protein